MHVWSFVQFLDPVPRRYKSSIIYCASFIGLNNMTLFKNLLILLYSFIDSWNMRIYQFIYCISSTHEVLYLYIHTLIVINGY